MSNILENRVFSTVLLILFFVLIISSILFIRYYIKKRDELLIKNRLNEIEHKNDLLNQELENKKSLDIERERIAHDIHDDLGATLSDIMHKSEYIEKLTDDENIKIKLKEIVDSTLEVTKNMREMMWSLNGSNDVLINFIYYSKNYINNFFTGTSIEPNFYNLENIDDKKIMNGFIRRNFFLCVKEVCHNIMKHSQASEVEVHFDMNDNIFKMTISDNGIGLNKDFKKGNGFHSLEKRMERLQGRFKHSSSPKGLELVFLVKL